MLHRRRLVHSKLSVKDTGSKKQKQVVIALSGIPSPGDGSYQAIPAQVQIFKENYDPSSTKTRKSFHNPKMSIGLEAAQVSVIGSQSQLSRRKSVKGSGLSCSFRVTTKEGTCYEFVADNESERLVWVTVLEFLAMFPYSSVPEVPKCSPVFSSDLEPSLYNADSVWPVYILPEEVGSRCSIIGTNALALQGRVVGSRPGKLEIYSPADSSDPIISWDHDKIRRTGMLGHLLFVEIGRRCRGGPGLVWIYAGNCDKKVYELKDVLRRFLFEEVSSTGAESPTQPVQHSAPLRTASSPQISQQQQRAPPPLPPVRRSNSTVHPASSSISAQTGTDILTSIQQHFNLLEPTTTPS